MFRQHLNTQKSIHLSIFQTVKNVFLIVVEQIKSMMTEAAGRQNGQNSPSKKKTKKTFLAQLGGLSDEITQPVVLLGWLSLSEP